MDKIMDMFNVLIICVDQYEITQNSSSSVQSLSCVQLFVTPWTEAHQASLSITSSQSLPKLMSIWEGNRQEGQGSPNGRNRLQVSDIFISLKQQEETN